MKNFSFLVVLSLSLIAKGQLLNPTNASNLGAGEGFFVQKSDGYLQFKSLTSTSGNVTVTSSSTTVDIGFSTFPTVDGFAVAVLGADAFTPGGGYVNLYAKAAGLYYIKSTAEVEQLAELTSAQTWTAVPNFNAGMTASATINLNSSAVMAEGKGIDFSANSNMSGTTSEVLLDYEFGSVSVPAAATGTSGTPTYTANWGSYQKVGRRVSLDAYVNVSSWAGSPTGNLRFTLPFQASNVNTNYRSVCKVGYVDNLSIIGSGVLAGVISNNSNYVDMYTYPTSGTGTTTNVAVDTAFLIMFSCDYIAD